MTEQLTQEQEAILDAVSDRKNSIIVQAGPGCGKTFTNVQTMLRAGPGFKMGLAYNKPIADELKLKAPTSVTIQTSHANGLVMLKRAYRSRVNSASPYRKDSKAYRHVQSTLPNRHAEDFGNIAAVLTTGMDLHGFGHDPNDPTTPDDWRDLLFETSMEPEDQARVASALPRILEKYCGETDEIGFPDMLILPLRYNLKPQFPQTQLWGDEIQDWSYVQLLLAQKQCAPHSLVYGFGDAFQSIYAFRGADIHSMPRFRDFFQCQTMPLTQSFRCPVRVIDIARGRNPDLRPRPGAPEGDVRALEGQISVKHLTEDARDTMILCRYNAPLFSLGLRFLSQQQPVRVSSSLPTSLTRIIKSMKTTDMTIFAERLEIWFRGQLEQAGETHHLVASVNDKYSALVSLMKASRDVQDMMANLDRLTRGVEGPLLSTIHRAKGLEAERVIILMANKLEDPRYFNMPEDEADPGLIQDWNLWFVAVTRSKHDLWFA